MGDKFKRALALLAALVVATFGGLAIGSPAQAAYSDCAGFDGTICFHEHSNFTGQVWRQFPGQIIGCRNFTPDSFNDEASTVFNLTDTHILYLYEHSNCTGSVLSVGKGEVKSFAQTNTWWNDKGSSVFVKYVGR